MSNFEALHTPLPLVIDSPLETGHRAREQQDRPSLLGTHMVSDPVWRLRRQSRIMDFFDAELRPRSRND